MVAACAEGSGIDDRPVFVNDADAGAPDADRSIAVEGGALGDGAKPNVCKVLETTGDGIPPCEEQAPPSSFDPVVQWTWKAPDPIATSFTLAGSIITPLVGNFTDDNGDGAVDLCDTPDIVAQALVEFQPSGNMNPSSSRLHLLSGDQGFEHFAFEGLVDSWVSPAFGDLDGDGLPEVVSADTDARVVVYQHDGTLAATGDHAGYRDTFSSAQCAAAALYDLDADGKVEILLGFEVFDATGKRLFGVPGNGAQFENQFYCTTPTAADLDADGKLEVLFGHTTYRADGSVYWTIPDQPPSHPHVANLDSDPEPEVMLTNMNGIMIVEHDGTPKFGPVRPTDPTPWPNCWGKPGVIHDFDNDGIADIGFGTCKDFSVYRTGSTDLSIAWSREVSDLTGLATATAFDFLGDGIAEAIYGDETQIYVFDGTSGKDALTAPRLSRTSIEYPVVADIDNDGSAELLVVSNYVVTDGQVPGASVTALRDGGDRWVRARRIWNQHAYHVSNVREDGTIPKQPKPSWQLLNTYRTNAQVGAQGLCKPATPH